MPGTIACAHRFAYLRTKGHSRRARRHGWDRQTRSNRMPDPAESRRPAQCSNRGHRRAQIARTDRGRVVGPRVPCAPPRAASGSLPPNSPELQGVLEADVSASGPLLGFDPGKVDALVRTSYLRGSTADQLRGAGPARSSGDSSTADGQSVPSPRASSDHDHGRCSAGYGELDLRCRWSGAPRWMAVLRLAGRWPAWISTRSRYFWRSCWGMVRPGRRSAICGPDASRIDTLQCWSPQPGIMALGAGRKPRCCCFCSVWGALEHWAMGRARRAIDALATLAPERATHPRHGDGRGAGRGGT